MNDDTVGFIQGTNVNSESCPITYKALKSYEDAVQKLNDSNEITVHELASHFDQAIRDLYATVGEIETRTNFVVHDET